VKASAESLVSLSLGVTELCFRAVAKDWEGVEKMSEELEEMMKEVKIKSKVEEEKRDWFVDLASLNESYKEFVESRPYFHFLRS
jgi:hypothetical protein